MIGIDSQEAAEQAYTQARAGFELFGIDLHPYSPSRKVAAQRMGMLYPFVGEDGAEQLQRTGAYAGMLNDAITVLWLCSLPDKDALWTPSKALSKPEQAKEAALEWAESHSMLDMSGEPFTQAVAIFMAIVQGVSASEYRLAIEGAPASEDEPPKV